MTNRKITTFLGIGLAMFAVDAHAKNSCVDKVPSEGLYFDCTSCPRAEQQPQMERTQIEDQVKLINERGDWTFADAKEKVTSGDLAEAWLVIASHPGWNAGRADWSKDCKSLTLRMDAVQLPNGSGHLQKKQP